jgi:hypothetical protein
MCILGVFHTIKMVTGLKCNSTVMTSATAFCMIVTIA